MILPLQLILKLVLTFTTEGQNRSTFSLQLQKSWTTPIWYCFDNRVHFNCHFSNYFDIELEWRFHFNIIFPITLILSWYGSWHQIMLIAFQRKGNIIVWEPLPNLSNPLSKLCKLGFTRGFGMQMTRHVLSTPKTDPTNSFL